MVVNDVQLRTLLDSGPTHNFIDSAAADRATVSFQECAGLRIAVANDDRLTSPSRCQGLHLNVVGEVFRIDCYGLALESFDTVLGVQWLESLGPILWDFSHRTMAFVRNGRHICWTTEEAGTGRLSSLQSRQISWRNSSANFPRSLRRCKACPLRASAATTSSSYLGQNRWQSAPIGTRTIKRRNSSSSVPPCCNRGSSDPSHHPSRRRSCSSRRVTVLWRNYSTSCATRRSSPSWICARATTKSGCTTMTSPR
jgi:hypothetical protein